jgi:hypothetical protein
LSFLLLLSLLVTLVLLTLLIQLLTGRQDGGIAKTTYQEYKHESGYPNPLVVTKNGVIVVPDGKSLNFWRIENEEVNF